ncbi:MAG: hypothetical protein ISN29_10175, partial [Gammaproteobacteria bacterium AqS3]|nr:hypothetical protein [Gammaproteobacteria bacterium AqS3]
MSTSPADIFCSRQRQQLLLFAGALLMGLAFSLLAHGQDTSPGLVLSETSMEFSRNYDSDSLYVHLKTKPTGPVAVTWVSSDPDFGVNNGLWLFDQSNWETPQQIDYVWRGGPDLIDNTVILSMNASGGGYDGVSESVTFTIFDSTLLAHLDDASWSINVMLVEGSSATFPLRLSQRPSENVTVTLQPGENFNRINATFDTDADTPGNQHTLTFTPTNWHIEQMVTVSAAAGAFEPGIGSYLGTLHVLLPNGGRNEVLIVASRANAHLKHFEVSPHVLILEEGSSQTITIRMLSPSSSTISLANDRDTLLRAGISIDKPSITFTPSNWNIPQTVTVSALDDDDASDERGWISFKNDVAPHAKHSMYFVRDNDAGLNVSMTANFIVPEGFSEMFTVRLNSRPSGTVRVNVPNPSSSDLTVDTDPLTSGNQNTLTFTPSNWSTPQTVKVSAAEDADAIKDTGYIDLTVSGNETDYAGQTARVRITVDDDDLYPIIEMASDPLVVPEGGSATFTVRMAGEISRPATVLVNKENSKKYQNKDVTFDTNPLKAGSQKSLRFTRKNWNVPQTVTVSAAEDDDQLFETELLVLETLARKDYLSILVADNDAAALTLATTNLGILEGSGKDFTVVLAAQPSGNVTVQLAQEGTPNGDVTLSTSSLTFTRGNWSAPQTVRVSASQDHDAIDDSTAISLTPSGGGYENLNRRVAVKVDDDDEVGLMLSSDDLTIMEGDSEEFKVQLATQPSGNVTVTLRQPENTDVTLDTDTGAAGNQNTLTFTARNWNQPQTVTVSTIQDDDTLDDSASIALAASGGDYKDVTASMEVSVTERSEAGLVLSARSVKIYEGDNIRFTVRLKTRPGSDVTVRLAQPDNVDVTVDTDANASGNQNELTFTASNWSDEQTVTVNAAEDDDAASDSATISLTASGDDYGGVAGDVTVAVADDDTPGLTVTPTTLTVDEGGSKTFTIQLAAQPDGDRTIALTSNDDKVTVDKPSLTFTSDGWNTIQTVTVKAAEDTDLTAYSARVTLTASGGDYADETETVTVNVTDNDTAALVIAAADPFKVAEGDNSTFTVRLAARPSGNVRVTLAQPENTDVTVDTDTGADNNQNTLDFTNSNWDTAQTVTVNAVRDDDTTDDSAAISLTASGGGYSDATGSVLVRVTENDQTGLTITPTQLTVDEGGSENFTVELTSRPSGSVTITLSQSGAVNTDVMLSKSSLRFTPTNWGTEQTVTVNAAWDDDTTEDRATISLTASGGDYAGVTASLPVTVKEKLGLTLSPTSLTISEGGGGTFTIKPVAQPSTDVTVRLTSSNNKAVTVDTGTTGSQDTLTFSPSNWGTARTVTVNASEDDDAQDSTVTIQPQLRVTNDDGTHEWVNAGSSSVTVSVIDDDVQLKITPNELAVSEGGSGTFEVRLKEAPSSAARVNISLPSGSDLTLDKTTLTFDADNWNVYQTVTVSAGRDDDSADDVVTIALGGDDVGIGSVTVTVREVVQAYRDENILIIEEGGSDTFSYVLRSKPSGDRSIAMRSTDADVTLSTAGGASSRTLTLTFTPDNWSRAQSVTVSVAEDDTDVSDSDAYIDFTLDAGLVHEDGVDRRLQVGLLDDDIGLTLAPTSLTVAEGGSGTFTVKPSSEIKRVRKVSLESNSDEVTISPSSLTFYSTTEAQTVTVTAAEDADGANDTATITLTGNPLKAASLTVTVNDDDVGLEVSTTSLTIAEGGNDTFTVQLASRPSGDVTVTLTQPTEFTVDNWDDEQTVTVKAAEDADAIVDTAEIEVQAGDGDYADSNKTVTVRVTENQTAALTVTADDPFEVDEGGEKTFEVRLATRPSGDVTVTLSQSGEANADVSFDADAGEDGDQNTLTFTIENWDEDQTVTVRAAEDPDAIADSVALRLSAEDGDYDGVSITLSISVRENDTAALTITADEEPLKVDEGGEETFNVALATKPSANVTVTLAQPDNTDVTIDTTSLTFTTSNWNRAQTVTVRAAGDDDATDDRATISLSASGGGYASVSGALQVKVKDDDAAELVLSWPGKSKTVPEDDTVSVLKVRLKTRPSAEVTVDVGLKDSPPRIFIST